ncbi:hypothetical protein [Actinokineospora enzanensis]|uniref:hypothetical protein n=1 Tax=Actinokineospora enzanensis TaxID=155975 RepID=UPI0003AB488E|nr:hypothetical protein [Actinokineospora enzanensis]
MGERKPLRRVAWVLFLGGIAITAVMIAMGWFLLRHGETAGPGHAASLQEGVEVGVFRPGGAGDVPDTTFRCEITSATDGTWTRYLSWGTVLSDVAGSGSITCENPATVLSGPAATAVGLLRGPLIAVPMFAAVIGLLLFFPRFAGAWAGFSRPFGRRPRRRSGDDG